MEHEFAAGLADLRLVQTAQLLEWMLSEAIEPQAISRALDAVDKARELTAGLAPSSPGSPAVR